MRIKEFIEEEIALEKRLLDDVKKKSNEHPSRVLIISRRRNGTEKYLI